MRPPTPAGVPDDEWYLVYALAEIGRAFPGDDAGALAHLNHLKTLPPHPYSDAYPAFLGVVGADTDGGDPGMYAAGAAFAMALEG